MPFATDKITARFAPPLFDPKNSQQIGRARLFEWDASRNHK